MDAADTQPPARERGAIEELVAKRIRPLKKKIQRLRNYAAQDESTLNADQRAALATLPQLEVAARELDDLAKQVEEAELVAAARQRELREAAEREHEKAVAERMAQFHQQLGAKLGGFLRLHALLHPARPSDTENLTFAPLILPLRLQDEVLATDILRVARMYEDLVSGSDNAGAVLAGLVAGPREEDEEDERVHHLLALLSNPDPEPETSEISGDDNDTASNAAQPPMSVRDSDAGYTTPNVASEDSDTDTDTYPPDIDPLATPVATMRTFEDAAAANLAGTTRGVALNFLQEDELAADADTIVIDTTVVEQTYEVIEPPSALASSVESVAADTPSSMDWTADDDATDDVAAALLEAALTPGAATPDIVAVTAAVDVVTVDSSGPGTPADPASEVGETLDSDKPAQRQRKPRKPRNRNGDKQAKDGAAPAPAQAQQAPAQTQAQAPGKGKPRQTDDDGFEVKVARRASAQRGRGGRGRGGGRGGAPREGQRPKDGQQGGQGQGQQAKRTGTGQKPKEAKPKPSIYKTTQPTAPASAPIF